MSDESVVLNAQQHFYVLPQRPIDGLRLLLVMLVSSLLSAAGGPTMAGEVPLPIVEVQLTEYAIRMPTTVPPGPVAFSVTNAGTEEHNFEVEGQGIEEKFAITLKPGETKSLRVDLPAGTYTIYCPVDDHKEQGMHLELKVAQQQSDRATPLATSRALLQAGVPAGG